MKIYTGDKGSELVCKDFALSGPMSVQRGT